MYIAEIAEDNQVIRCVSLPELGKTVLRQSLDKQPELMLTSQNFTSSSFILIHPKDSLVHFAFTLSRLDLS